MKTRSFFATYLVIQNSGDTIPSVLTYRGEDGERLANATAEDLKKTGRRVEVTKVKPLRCRDGYPS